MNRKNEECVINEKYAMRTALKRQLAEHRKFRLALVLLLGLWIAAGTKFVAERIYLKEENLREAFASVSTGTTTSSLEYVAECKEEFLTEKDKKELLAVTLSRLGITMDKEPEIQILQNGEAYVYEKQAVQARTRVKLLSLTAGDKAKTYYVVVNIAITNDTGDSILYYRERLEALSEELGAETAQSSLLVEGRFLGNLSPAARNELADLMLERLGCRIVAENRSQDMYTIYAYTYGMNEYIVSDGNRINVQLAMYYDETNDKTVVYLASPIINTAW